MIKKIGLSLLTLSLLTTGLFAKADHALVTEYMNISGANISIESLGEQITANATQSSMMFGKPIDTKKITFLQEAFNSTEGVEIVTNYLSEHFENKELKEILAYYKTPLGKKVVQAALDAMESDTQAKMLHFMADLSQNPPSKDRVTIIKSFISQLEIAATAQDMVQELLYYLNEEASEDRKVSKQDIDQMLPMINQALEQQLFISSLYIYRNIDNNEIKKVISFYDTKAGKEELKVVNNAMKEMLKKGFSRALNKK